MGELRPLVLELKRQCPNPRGFSDAVFGFHPSCRNTQFAVGSVLLLAKP